MFRPGLSNGIPRLNKPSSFNDLLFPHMNSLLVRKRMLRAAPPPKVLYSQIDEIVSSISAVTTRAGRNGHLSKFLTFKNLTTRFRFAYRAGDRH